MAGFSNDTLSGYTQPVSGSENTTIQNVLSMVRDAVNSCVALRGLDIEVFLQGSYANNTNVRLNSDVDINVCLKSTFYYHLPEGRTKENYNISDSSTRFTDYKDAVEKAMVDKFGRENVKRKNKCIHIKENTYHHDADVVPTFEYRDYGYWGVNNSGVKFLSDDNKSIINYPKQQVANSTDKNEVTHRRFKRTVRIFKRIRYQMKDNHVELNPNISSFLIESLLWNVPSSLYDEDDLNTRVKDILGYLFLKAKGPMKDWNEESNLLPLFSNERKWTLEDVKQFVMQVFKYLGYADE